MNQTKIAFIGGGNMAFSLLGGLVAAGWDAAQLSVADPLDAPRRRLIEAFGVRGYVDNSACIEAADVVVFAVKPQCFQVAATSIAAASRSDQLMLSITAGIALRDALKWLGGVKPFIRAMPNTPALINQGVTGLFANPQVSAAQKAVAEQIMSTVGAVVWLEQEDLIDSVTGVSGSGPAYFFRLMETLIDSAVQHGLQPHQAEKLVLKTALGAAMLANQSEHSPATLRQQVTSPNGTTQAALARMDELRLDACIKGGVDAAVQRSKLLCKQLGAN